jgi:hypothetical protein
MPFTAMLVMAVPIGHSETIQKSTILLLILIGVDRPCSNMEYKKCKDSDVLTRHQKKVLYSGQKALKNLYNDLQQDQKAISIRSLFKDTWTKEYQQISMSTFIPLEIVPPTRGNDRHDDSENFKSTSMMCM